MSAFPDALTDRVWQRNKGVLAKSKPTGIGKTLIELEKAYGTSAFSIDVTKSGAQTTDPVAFEKLLDSYTKTLAIHARKLDSLAAATQTKIDGAKRTFADDQKVLSVLGDLQGSLASFRNDIKANGALAQACNEAIIQAFAKNLVKSDGYRSTVGANLAAGTEQHRQKVFTEIRALQQDPRVAKLHDLWKSNGSQRSLSTVPKLWDQVLTKAFPQTVRQISPASAMKTYVNDLPWVSDVGDEPGGKASTAVRQLAEQTDEKRAVLKLGLEYTKSLVDYGQFCRDLVTLETELKKYARYAH